MYIGKYLPHLSLASSWPASNLPAKFPIYCKLLTSVIVYHRNVAYICNCNHRNGSKFSFPRFKKVDLPTTSS